MQTSMRFDSYIPTRVLFGAGQLDRLASSELLPGKRALVVIGCSGAMVRAGHLDRVERLLASAGVESVDYDGIEPNPTTSSVDLGVERALHADCDCVLGLGGGSTIDAAKAIALAAANRGPYWDFVQRGTGGKKTPTKPALPIVAIPTTAGTGTETDPWMVVSNPDTMEKMGNGNDSTFPTLSIVDPELTLSLPPTQTAYTGMDAFFHAVECFLSTRSQPINDLLALEAISLVANNLPAAVHQGTDITARTAMSWAACAAGYCQALSGVLSLHAMEHALSGRYPAMPHGAGLVLLAEPYFAFLEERMDDIFRDLAWAVCPDENMRFVDCLSGLRRDCGLADESLADYGMNRADIPDMVEATFAMAGKHFDNTPVEMTRDDVRAIFEAAYAGA